MSKIKRAILSCYDKTGIVELAELLVSMEVEIISTSGTLKVLQDAGIPAKSISEFTGVPELLDGRVKSLHWKVHAGLLGIRDKKLHMEQMQEHGLEWIDLLVANPKPLETILEQPGIGLDEVIDQVDIGGTAMIRSAAKNFRYETVVVNPQKYPALMHELRAHECEVPFTMRYALAQEAFTMISEYDKSIADYLTSAQPPEQ